MDKAKLRDAAQNERIAHDCRHRAERLYADGRTADAAEQLAQAQALEKQAQDYRRQAKKG